MKQISFFIFSLIISLAPTLAKDKSKSSKAKELTISLAKLNKHYQKANNKDKDSIKDNMLKTAQQRQELLKGSLATDPSLLEEVVIPEHIKSQMPEEVREKLEQKVTLKGKIERLIEDYPDHSHRERIFLKTEKGKKLEMHFSGKTPDLQTDTSVQINGLMLDNKLAPNSSENSLLTLAADGSINDGNNAGVAMAGPSTIGEQKLLVMMVKFQDDPTEPFTKATIESRLNTANQFIRENSYQQTWFNTTVTDWMTLPLNITDPCDYNLISAESDKLANQAGINVSDFQRLMYIFPKNTCSYLGLGTVGGSPSRAWIRGIDRWATITHELGHNLGLYHSRDYNCNETAISGTCTTNEYGDYSDIMGAWVSGHFNIFQKERLGWLSDKILTVTQSGNYHISSHEILSNEKMGIRIPRSITNSNSTLPWYYYIEMRKAVGFDSVVADFTTNFLDGVSVHLSSPDYGNSSFLLNMTPETQNMLDGALGPGRSFTDDTNGIQFTTISADENGAEIAIDINSPTQDICLPVNPTVDLVPLDNNWIPAGTTLRFTVSVANNDSSACSDNTFNLSMTIPAGWSQTLSSSSITLAPKTKGEVALSITSSIDATDGYYLIVAYAKSGTFGSNDGFNIAINNPVGNNPPIANDDNVATKYESPITVDALANDSDPEGDQLSITSFTQPTQGSVLLSAGIFTYNPNSGFSGKDSFSYTISDGNNNTATATVSITVASPEIINSPPLAASDAITTEFETAVQINVLGNDSDPDADQLSIVNYSQATHGILLLSSGNFSYTPDAGFSGSDSFSYTISDNKGGSATALVSITVKEAPVTEPPPPTAEDTIDPSVTITSPVDGTTVSSKQKVLIEVEAQDNVKVDRVEFYVNGNYYFSDAASPYTYTFRVPNGSTSTFEIEARAIDTSGRSASAFINLSKSTSTTTGGGGKGRNK